MQVLIYIRDALWGLPTAGVLVAFGAYFTIRLGFYKPKMLVLAFAKTFFAKQKQSNGGNLSSLAALSTALGGTVGVGSISGVALAISLGGAGSVFWMWLCAFLGIGLKYAEVALAHSRRIQTAHGYTGGAMYCLMQMGKKNLAYLFAVLTVVSAMAGGSVVQAGALAETVGNIISGKLLGAFAVAALTLAVISGGKRYIAGFNTVALPLVSVAYVFLCLSVIIGNLQELPSVFARIFGEAFGIRPAIGGISVAAMLRVGCTRGTFSNEAGMGSSPLSYCAGSEKSPHIQGLWGVTEVVIDSFVVSTLTALCLLCTGCDSVLSVFSNSFGIAGGHFYLVSLGIFAFAAIISWCFYGEQAMRFLFPNGKKVLWVFKLLVAAGAFCGALMSEGGAFAAADIWGVLMLAPNLYLLFKSRSDIVALANEKC